jgi:hypothetical protein
VAVLYLDMNKYYTMWDASSAITNTATVKAQPQQQRTCIEWQATL